MTEAILRAEHISKAFVGVQALDDVSVEINRGQIHCLAGENGSGKSTFVKTVSGVYQPDEGKIVLDGVGYDRLTPDRAMRAGVQVIYQDLSLFQHMTVAENIALPRLRQSGRKWIDWNEIYKIAQAQLDRIGVALDLNATVMEISMANRQLTAICRALAQDAKLLFMDEPTTALTKTEVAALLRVVQELKRSGLAVAFISHKLDEVFAVADEITVFRDGKKVGGFACGDLNPKRLSYYMTGREVEYPRYARAARDDAPLIEVKHLSKKGNYEDVSFSVRRGDIVGVTGLLGSGRTELALSLFGLNPPDGGEIWFEGKRLSIGSPSEAEAAGIALLPEDRATLGMFRDRSIRENVTSAMLGGLAGKFGALDFARERTLAAESVRKLRVRAPSVETAIGALSGGNQQKALVAKWINTAPKLFIMDAPTVGVDIGSKAEIYELIQGFAAEGMAILLITDELEELLANCNRALIMADGRCAAQLDEVDLRRADAAQRIAALVGGQARGKEGEAE